MEDVVDRLREFIESEMRSCSMDIGWITPDHVQRAWGGRVAIEEGNKDTDKRAIELLV